MANTNVVVNYPGVAEVAGMVISPNGGQVVYVGTAAMFAGLGQTGEAISSRFYTSVNAAINACVTGRGDYIYVLPGYTESITADAWSNLAATDVTVCGLGHGTNRPTFTWTVAGSTMLFDVANFRLLNCNLYLAGAHAAGSALTVAAPITISAAGCEISDCTIFYGFDADQIVTIGITTTAAADHFRFDRNWCYAEVAAATGTTFMQLVGADFMQMNDTTISGASSGVNVGIVRFLTTASTGVTWNRCVVQNQLAASVSAVTGLANSTGRISYCGWGILDNATKAGFTTPANFQFFNCKTVNDNGENGADMTPVSA